MADEGIDVILTALQNYNDVMIEALPLASAEGARLLEIGIRRNAPRITGELQNKITVKAGEQVGGDGWARADHIVLLGADYSKYVEFGHKVRNRSDGPVIGGTRKLMFASRAMRSRRGQINTAIRQTLLKASDIPSLNVSANIYIGGRG